MRKKAQLWINVSNREESMARVLSRSDFAEGTVLHAVRAASAALVAVLVDHGWAHTSDRCEDLCDTLRAHEITAPADVLAAARALDAHREKLDPEPTGTPPANACTGAVAATCLKAATRIRHFVNTVLTR